MIAEEVSLIAGHHTHVIVLLVHGWNIIEPRVDFGLGVRQIQGRLQPPRGAYVSASDAFIHSHALALAYNAKHGARLYDFLAGANRLKENFATNRYKLFWQVLRRPRLDHRLRAAARHIRRKIAR